MSISKEDIADLLNSSLSLSEASIEIKNKLLAKSDDLPDLEFAEHVYNAVCYIKQGY